MVDYQRAKPVSLKGHPTLNEKWLQERIAADTTLLGLGELLVKDIERRHPRAGRLDLGLDAASAARIVRKPLAAPPSRFPWSVLWRAGDSAEHVRAFVRSVRALSRRLGWLEPRGQVAG